MDGATDEREGSFILVRDPLSGQQCVRLQPGVSVTVGRAPTNTVVLRDERASRFHAEIHHDGAGWLVRDLGSRNGTIVGDQQITSEQRLAHGDIVGVGTVEIVFHEGARPKPVQDGEHEADTDGGSAGITGELAEELQPWHAAIQHRRARSRLLDEIRESARTAPRIGRAAAELCRLAFALGRADSIPAAATKALESAMLGCQATQGIVLLPEGGTNRRPGCQLSGVAAVPSNFDAAGVPQLLIDTILGTDEAVLACLPDGGRHAAVTTLSAPVRADGKPVGVIHLVIEASGHEASPDDLEFLMAVCESLGQSVANVGTRERLSNRLATANDENRQLLRRLGVESHMVGSSPALERITGQIGRVATTRATVLIRGESGAGKELVARAIHESSDRRDRPFVCLNCAALSETLLESELFGHEKGAFTGATERKAGKFEAADNGTLFLDEIGEMSPAIQAKFLRVLEGHPFERVGGSTRISVDVRVVAATNRRLEEAVADGGFRRDLYFRLRVVEILVPPLRERREDIEPLARHFLDRFSAETGRRIAGYTPRALEALRDYHWPGNIRELRNCIERAVVLAVEDVLDEGDLMLSSLGPPGETGRIPTGADVFIPEPLAVVEKRHILRMLESTGGNKSKAAAMLGIERSTLDRKLTRWSQT